MTKEYLGAWVIPINDIALYPKWKFVFKPTDITSDAFVGISESGTVHWYGPKTLPSHMRILTPEEFDRLCFSFKKAETGGAKWYYLEPDLSKLTEYLEDKNERLFEHCKNLDREINGLNDLLRTARTELALANSNYNIWKEQAQGANAQIENLRAAYKSLKAQLADACSIEAWPGGSPIQINCDLRIELADARGAIECLKRDNNNLGTELKDLRECFDKLRSEAEAAIKGKEAQAREWEALLTEKKGRSYGSTWGAVYALRDELEATVSERDRYRKEAEDNLKALEDAQKELFRRDCAAGCNKKTEPYPGKIKEMADFMSQAIVSFLDEEKAVTIRATPNQITFSNG